MTSWIKSVLCVPRVRCARVRFPKTGFQIIPTGVALEEQTLESWSYDRYYSARIGEVLHDRYQLLGKLGYGTTSTAWLARDLKTCDFQTIKICTRAASRLIESGRSREVQAYDRLKSALAEHAGHVHWRTLNQTIFVADQEGQRFACLVHEPLGPSLEEVRRMLKTPIPEELIRHIIRYILIALDYLHEQVRLVHTGQFGQNKAMDKAELNKLDLKSSNILMRVHDLSVLQDFESVELEYPVPRQVDGDRITYMSRTMRACKGMPVIVDLGEARDAETMQTDDIMPDQYRAPEVMIGASWDSKVDIWNVGVLAWQLVEDESLFRGLDEAGKISNRVHFAEMVALLGLPPPGFVERGGFAPEYFHPDGTWTGLAPIPDTTLEKKESMLQGPHKARFLDFIRHALRWDYRERPTARELLGHEYMTHRDTVVEKELV